MDCHKTCPTDGVSYPVLALLYSIPSENTPSSGPPTAPSTVLAILTRDPNFDARKARPILTAPYAAAVCSKVIL